MTKADSSDYSASWQDPSGGDVTADMLGIVIDGNSTPVGAAVGQYVIVKDSTISGVTDGLYKAALPIPANTAIDDTYLNNKVDDGGLNSLGDKLSKYGKVLWEGNFSGPGNLYVPGISNYVLVGIVPAAGSGASMMIGSSMRGGLVFGTYASAGSDSIAYRFGYSAPDTLTVSNNDRGAAIGGGTTYSGDANCNIIKIIGLIPNN